MAAVNYVFPLLSGMRDVKAVKLVSKMNLLSAEYIEEVKKARSESGIALTGINDRAYVHLSYYGRSLQTGIDPKWLGANFGHIWPIWKAITEANGKHLSSLHCENAIILYCAGFRSYSRFAAEFLNTHFGLGIPGEEERVKVREALQYYEQNDFPEWIAGNDSRRRGTVKYIQLFVAEHMDTMPAEDILLAICYSNYGLHQAIRTVGTDWPFEPNMGVTKLPKEKKKALLEKYQWALKNCGSVKDLLTLEAMGLPLRPYLQEITSDVISSRPGALKSFRKFLQEGLTNGLTVIGGNWGHIENVRFAMHYFGVPPDGEGIDANYLARNRSMLVVAWVCRLCQKGQMGNFLRETKIQVDKDREVRWRMVEHLDSLDSSDVVDIEANFSEVIERYRNRIAATWMKGEEVISEIPEELEEVPEGIQILDTANRLRAEGKIMNHCVGTYVNPVESRRSYIFHVDVGNSSSTLEIRKNRNEEYYIEQNKASSNRNPTEEVAKYSQEFVDLLNKARVEREQAAALEAQEAYEQHRHLAV